MKQPRTLQEAIAYFADPDRAFEYAVKLRFPDSKIYCPRCGAEKYSFIKTRRIWFCYACKKQFTVKVKTIMEDSALGLDKWMTAVWMLVACKNGISSHELARMLGITQKSAWFMLHRIREALKGRSFGGGKIGGSGSEVETDEKFVGGRIQNMHKDVDEQVFRYNNRKHDDNSKMTDAERFNIAMTGLAGRRLTYDDLTGKAESPHHQTTGTGQPQA